MTATVANPDNSQKSPQTASVLSHDAIFQSMQTCLPKYLQNGNVETVLQNFDSKIGESAKISIETAVRHFVVNFLFQGKDTDLTQIIAIAKLSVSMARKEVCLPTLPMLVLSDAFDTLTVQQCEKLFSFVEGSVAVWKESLFFAPCKNQVLRMCNDVLRRLSRSQNTIFCGRILLFLAMFFPFSERSGLNLISEFNLENVTNYSTGGTEDAMETSVADEAGDNKDSVTAKDSTLYTKFWALQDYFRNPLQCYQKDPWKQFVTFTTDVLEAFGSFKLEGSEEGAEKLPVSYISSAEDSKEDLEKTIIDTLPDVKKTDQYFAKFLTNERLLDLQFSDSNFRRYILLQLLVTFHYLCSPVKFKQETLGSSEAEWVRSTEEKVYSLLSETPPDGKQFVVVVKRTLRHEDQWNDWKNSGCPEIKKPPSAQTTAIINGKHEAEDEDSKAAKRGKKRKLGDIIKEAESRKKFTMANNEMTRLWNICADNSEATRLRQRDFTPSLEEYFKRAVDQVMSGEEQPSGEKLVSDSDFGWRALRILACRSPHFFTHSTAPIATLPEYLTTMVRRLAKDQMPVNGQAKESVSQSAPQQQNKQTEKGISDNSDEEMEGGEDEPEEDTEEREELQPITKEEQMALASSLSKLSTETWKNVMVKFGFQTDEVDYILGEKGGKVETCIEHFLQLWVENEGEEANKEALVYTLGGLKLSQVAEEVFK